MFNKRVIKHEAPVPPFTPRVPPTILRSPKGDIQTRAGLLRCYISRVENGHAVPAIETLEKLARAMEIPLYQVFTMTVRLRMLQTDRLQMECRFQLPSVGFAFTSCKAASNTATRHHPITIMFS